VSRRVGETTVSYSKASRTGSFRKRKTTRSRAEVRRPLLTEGEVGSLEPERLQVIKAGFPAVLGWKMPYWRHPELRERAGYLAPKVVARPKVALKGREVSS
jgi:type IV secretory pathway TraG/TraD family ATPase VirD4